MHATAVGGFAPDVEGELRKMEGCDVAAWLLAPYLAWVSFAATLNFTLWRLNS